MARKTALDVDAEAAVWATRVDRGPLTAEEDGEFQRWLAGDVRRLGAYGRARAVFQATERFQALSPLFDPALFGAEPSTASRRSVLQAGSAIAAAAVVGLGAIRWRTDAKTR